MRWTGWLLATTVGCGPSGGSGLVPGTSSAEAGAEAGGARGSAASTSAGPTGDDGGASGNEAGEFTAGDGFDGPEDCLPGTYVGTYQGTNDSSQVGGPSDFPVSGPMQLDLVRMETSIGESDLVTSHGAFEMTWGGTTTGDAAAGIVVVQAAITGQLDCDTRAFSAMSTSATWTLFGIDAGTADLTFSGQYDAATQTISGTFSVTDSLSTSTGTWSVTLGPGADP